MSGGSALAVRDLVIDRLATGVYPVGGKLPTARELAAELGVHRNTVAKAYRLLVDLGLVATNPGRGTYVTGQPTLDGNRTLLTPIRSAVGDLVRLARQLGLDEDGLRAMVDEQIMAVYAPAGRRGAFVECNRPEVDGHIVEVEALTGIRLSPLLLDHALDDVAATAARFDALFTTLFHIEELTEAIAAIRPDLPVVALYAAPDEQALEQIARIKPGARVAVIANNPESAHRFASLVRTYAEVAVETTSAPDDHAIRELAGRCDVVVSSHSREAQVRALGLPRPVVALPFHVSPQSVRRVSETLQGAVATAR
ncbi:MAG TPA: GntR family transcriptional regulator [Thermomicrobiaceae bacterium]|nr:GntR family transcriptional regulator [Thermomicrobiaceae bacterium]